MNPNLIADVPAKAKERPQKGFSLIEVTIALAIVSVSFVALLGILPVGLNTFTESVDSATESQIAQSILTEARQAKFSNLAAFATDDRFYFDDQGKILKSTDLSKKIYFCDLSKQDISVSFQSQLEVDKAPKAESYDKFTTSVAVVKITVRKISSPNQKRQLVGYIANNGL